MDEDDFETGDFIPEEEEGDFKTPLGENEDAASDDDELGPKPKRFRSDSESTTASGMIFRIFIAIRRFNFRFKKCFNEFNITRLNSGNFGIFDPDDLVRRYNFGPEFYFESGTKLQFRRALK